MPCFGLIFIFKMNKPGIRSILILLMFSSPFLTVAQDSESTLKSYERLYLENSWLSSENSTGIIYNSFSPDGVFMLEANYQEGDLHLSQFSPEESNYSFSTRKTIMLNNIVFDGGVEYLNQQQKAVGWTARMNPQTGNPYMLADSLHGLYSKDYVKLFGSFGYRMTDRIAMGIGVDYLVGDGARIKDPRPVNELFSLDIYPSIILNFSGIKIGANLHLLKGREEISYTTIENSTTYRFFRFFGLGKGAKTVNSWSYYRNYYNSGLGGELQTEYRIGNIDLFSGIGYLSKTEVAEDGSTIPRKNDSGDYTETDYQFYTIFRLKNDLIHFAKIFAIVSTGEGIEFLQEPYSEDGITYYRTIAEISKYSVFKLNPGLSYSLVKPYNNYLNKWSFEAGVEMEHTYNKYLLEADQTITNLIPSLNYNYSVFHQKNQWNLGIQMMYNLNLNNELKQLRSYTANQEISAWENVVYPDFLILSSNSFSIAPSIRYGKDFRLFEEKNNHVFIDLSGMYLNASNELWDENKTLKFLQLKIGITY
jgi:hypothetical protein